MERVLGLREDPKSIIMYPILQGFSGPPEEPIDIIGVGEKFFKFKGSTEHKRL